MNVAFSEAFRVPSAFGALFPFSSIDGFGKAPGEPMPPLFAQAIADAQRAQLDLFGNLLKLWLLPLNLVEDTPGAEATVAASEAAPIAPVAQPAPVVSPAVSKSVPDDLERINGIGPKLKQMLLGLGILHFRQIATLSAEEVASLNEKIGFKGRIEREGWQAQASRLSKAASAPQAA